MPAKHVQQAIDAVEATLAELPELPVRVDEMTGREFATRSPPPP